MCKFNVELFDASKVQPQESGTYLCIFVHVGHIYNVRDLYYSKKHDAFNCCDFYTDELVKKVALQPAYWGHMPMNMEEIKNGN